MPPAATFPVDFVTLVPQRSPNRYLMLPPDFAARAAPDRISPVFTVHGRALLDAWRHVAARHRRVRETRFDSARPQVEHVACSALFRFPDLITAEAVSVAGGSALAVYSRARYGYGDFGVNRRRIERWLAEVEHLLGSEPRAATNAPYPAHP